MWYRRTENLEFIVEEHEWDELRADLQKMLSSWAKGRDVYKDKTRRKCLYAKIEELNRVPLTDAFEEFKLAFSIDLDDLWPLFGTEAALSGIRNRIIHGDRFGPHESPALIISLDNLRWSVERAVLGVLGWPVERSTVSPRHLVASGLTAYNWRSYLARIGT